jgi:hypothetical protein
MQVVDPVRVLDAYSLAEMIERGKPRFRPDRWEAESQSAVSVIRVDQRSGCQDLEDIRVDDLYRDS